MNNKICNIKTVYESIEIGANFEREELTTSRYFENDPRARIVSRFVNFDANLLTTGVCTLALKNVVPISEETLGEGGVTLFEATRRCVHRTPFENRYSEAGLDDNVLTFKYLTALFKTLTINYVAAAIVFGIDLAEAKNLSKLELDKYTAAIFSIHYRINFTTRGVDGDGLPNEAKVNILIRKLGLETSMKGKGQLVCELRSMLFNAKDKSDNYFKIESVTDDKIEELAKLICEFRISPSYGSWMLSFNKRGSKKVYENILRRSWSPENKRSYLPYLNRRWEVAKLCENLLKNSIKIQCTTEEFIIAFLVASEIAMRLCNVSEDSKEKTRSWLSSKIYHCFENKVVCEQ